MLKVKSNKRAKKTETCATELQQYITFLEHKRNATFHGLAHFFLVTTSVTNKSSSKWDDTTSKMDAQEDRRGCPFGLIGFRCILGCTRQGIQGMPFYEPFMSKFMALKLLDMRESHVWMWIVKKRSWPP